MNQNRRRMFDTEYTQDGSVPFEQRSIVTGLNFGVTSGHVHSTSAFAHGNHIPAGRFLVDSPLWLSQYHLAGNRLNKSAILPDITGEHLKRADLVSDFSELMPVVLDEQGNFSFIGVSGSAHRVCKDPCVVPPCCPIGYEGVEARMNYWPLYNGDAMDIITQGFVTVYTETSVLPNQQLHVRVKVTDSDLLPCQLIGGVTTEPDDGTQALGSNVRVESPAKAGHAVLLELGGMSNR